MEQLLFIFVTVLLNSAGTVSLPKEIIGTNGGSVYFYESVENLHNYTLKWTFSNQCVASSKASCCSQRWISCCYQYVERCLMFANGTLRLDELRTADEGEYIFTDGDMNTYVYNLKVYAILSTSDLTSNGSLISGSNVHLHCDAGNQNVTTYTFYHDGKKICSEPHVTCRDSNLYFQPITESDSGSYNCTIQNPVSTSTSNTLQLNVSARVSNVSLTTNISGLVWPGIDSVSLTCSSRGTNVSYTWSLQGAPLPQDPRYHLTQSNSVLTISPVSANDNGTFNCTASNWMNNNTSNGVSIDLASAVASLNLTRNTSTEAEKEFLSLHCSAQGSAVNFSWSLNGQPLPQDSRYHFTLGDSPPHSNLIISPVSINEVGLFTCTASNKLNSMTSCGLTFSLICPTSCPIIQGLGGGEVAGIVTGVAAGITIIELTVFFFLKAKKKTPH